ncbi:MAG: hypothetical protein V1870_02645 [Candidatus Aenigmatarchaeota archaeon]
MKTYDAETEDYFTEAEKMVERVKSKPEWMPENPYKPKVNMTWTNQLSFLAFQEGGEAYTKTLIEWLFGKCTEHLYHNPFSWSEAEQEWTKTYYKIRYQCPECMQELKENIDN